MFHRLTTPAYFILGGGPLPGGYDYINNLGGTPAPADSAKVGGPNAGSYFITFGEDATSADANRPAKALAQNCDFLDDLLHRDIAVSTRTGDTTAGSPLSSVILTGPNIFLGPAGTPNTVVGIVTVFHLLDANDEEIVNTGVECQITAVAGGVIGSGGFSAGNVTLTISPAIPTGTIYRVYYATRTNLADLPVDALTNIKIRGAEEVPGELIGYGGSSLVGSNALPVWANTAANPAGTLFVQLSKIVNDLSSATGDDRIGSSALPAWKDATNINNPILKDNLDDIVNDLAAAAAGFDGSGRIGAAPIAASFVGAPYALATTSVRDQITDLLYLHNKTQYSRTVSTNITLDDGGTRDSLIFVGGSTNRTITLPDPALHKGRQVFIGRTDFLSARWTLTTGGVYPINTSLTDYVFGTGTKHGTMILYSGKTTGGVWGWFTFDASTQISAEAYAGIRYGLSLGTLGSQLAELIDNLDAHSDPGNTDHDARYKLTTDVEVYTHEFVWLVGAGATQARTHATYGNVFAHAFAVTYIEYDVGGLVPAFIYRSPPLWIDTDVTYDGGSGLLRVVGTSGATKRSVLITAFTGNAL